MMKKLMLILSLLTVLLLSGCGQKKAPDEKQIKENLQTSLSNYRLENAACELEVQAVDIVQSLTDAKKYTAQAKVIAESPDAEYYYTADVVYTYYDQGWGLDSCQWEMTSYKVVRYPEGDRWGVLKLTWAFDQEEIDTVRQDDRICLYGKKTFKDAKSFVVAEGTVVTTWVYNPVSGEWDFESQESQALSVRLTKELEGSWELVADSMLVGGVFTIANVTDTGFDAWYETSNGSPRVYRLTVDNSQIEYSAFHGTDYCRVNLKGQDEQNEKSMSVGIELYQTQVHDILGSYKAEFIIWLYNGVGCDIMNLWGNSTARIN